MTVPTLPDTLIKPTYCMESRHLGFPFLWAGSDPRLGPVLVYLGHSGLTCDHAKTCLRLWLGKPEWTSSGQMMFHLGFEREWFWGDLKNRGGYCILSWVTSPSPKPMKSRETCEVWVFDLCSCISYHKYLCIMDKVVCLDRHRPSTGARQTWQSKLNMSLVDSSGHQRRNWRVLCYTESSISKSGRGRRNYNLQTPQVSSHEGTKWEGQWAPPPQISPITVVAILQNTSTTSFCLG